MATDMPVSEIDNNRRLPTSSEEARGILRSIRIDRGFLGNEYQQEFAKMNEEAQQAVQRTTEALRRKTAKFTNSIAEELYSSKSRFIYELIQNADDSNYNSDRGKPCVTIRLFPDKVLLETNETGFTVADVKAICDTGESSKKNLADDKSIGEKGYGFKSVFSVAYRARIQSGLWSFYFEHHEGEDGLGRITPFDIDPDPLPAGVTTRIELLLHKDSSDLFESVSQALGSLPATAIFFLQHIETMFIHIHPSNGPCTRTEIERQTIQDRTVILKSSVSLSRKDMVQGCPETEETIFYHIWEQLVTGMPVNKRRKGISNSEIKLAFPINPKTQRPAMDADGEHVFAYLPMYQKSHLPFLIQGDFVTSNSRESVLDCAWNRHLRAGIADAFCNAIERLYHDETLRYQWLKYLPVSLKGGFETPLFSLIKDKLQDVPVFETWKSRSAVCPSQLRILPVTFTHKQEPLFKDLQEEAYLAPEYSSEDHVALKHLGIQYMSQHELLERLVYDLGRRSSRLRSTPASDSWHETCSSTLLAMLSSPLNEDVRRIIRSQNIIPLRSSDVGDDASSGVAEWVSAIEHESEAVYFPETRVSNGLYTPTRDTLLIPRGLSIRVVHHENSAGPQRRALFAKLGVTSCTPSTVVKAIYEFQRYWMNFKTPPSNETFVSHLQYLFWFRESQDPIKKTLIVVSDVYSTSTNSMLAGPVTRPFYTKSANPYDAWYLLKDIPALERNKLAAFISDEYIEAEPTCARNHHGHSWLQWLKDIVCLRQWPPLTDNNLHSPGLSPIMLHVLKNRPADFIPTLQAHWSAEYEKTISLSPASEVLLSLTEVHCERTRPTALSQTYMPLKLLKAEAERIGLIDHIPFLKLPGLVDDEYQSRWSFLSAFGVGSSENLEFYLDLLFHAQHCGESTSLPLRDIVVKIYMKIGALCNSVEKDSVKKRLVQDHGIYVPSSAWGQRWKQPSECLWVAPSCITIKSTLADHYGADADTVMLFHTYLQIQDVHPSDYLDQLRYFKRTGSGAAGSLLSHQDCAEVYQGLSAYEITSGLLENMKRVIEKEKLVFANNAWHSPSECLWSKENSISDRVSIGGIYADSEELFVSKLRVKTLTTAMLTSDLKKKAEAKTPLGPSDAKALILKINTMLAGDALDYGLQAKFNELESVKCFPVRGRDGLPRLTNAKADFAIVDHERYGRAFGQDAEILDFSLDEIQLLRPFIEATRITDHYLSELVTEVSEIEGSSTQSLELSAQLQRLAYALFCCAVHFKSTKIVGHNESLYESLQSLQVHEAEKMGSSLVLEQDQRTFRVPSSRTQLKIDTDANPWKMYVPKDTKGRKACYSSQVPRTMLSLLGISGEDATVAVYRLINEPHDYEHESSIMEQFDVLPISWITRQLVPTQPGLSNPISGPVYPNQSPLLFGRMHDSVSASTPAPILSDSSDASSTNDTSRSSGAFTNTNAPLLSTANESSHSTLLGGSSAFGSAQQSPNFSTFATRMRTVSATPLPTFSFGSSGHSGANPFGLVQTTAFGRSDNSTRRGVSATPAGRSLFASPAPAQAEHASEVRPSLQGQKYIALLDNIIKRVSDEDHTWNFNDLGEALPETVRLSMLRYKNETFGIRGDDQLAHDTKIGAAGEVFVFEKLMAAKLPGFGRNSWLSTIRSNAKVHERYNDMPDKSPDLEAGSRAEPADIVYSDPEGKFASFLETQDCVGYEDWLKTPPAPKRRYFIEVKTTTQSCDAAFYMSTSQHLRMLQMRKKSFIQANDVYIICRVYNLLSNDIAMRWYISPGRGEGSPVSNVFNFGILPNTTPLLALSGDAKPLLKFTSKGFEVRPVK